jgi:predicted site-specific integrase-resolvase
MRKLGQIEMGKDAVNRVVLKDNVRAVIFASDFSLKTKQDFKNKLLNCQRIFVMESNFVMEEIGQSLGRKKTGVVALLQSRITDEILLQINKLKEVEQ